MSMEGAGFCVPHCPASSLTAGWRGRGLCSRRRAGLVVASANVTLDNERESSCSVINFDAPGQQFALRQVIKAVTDAGLNTTRISISTDDDQKVVKSEFLVTNGNGKLAEVDFEPIRSNLSSLPEEPASVDGADDNPESHEYHIVEEIPVGEEDMERGVFVIVDNFAHPKFTTVTITAPTCPELSRRVMDLFASEKLSIRFCTLHTLNTEDEVGTDVYHLTTAQGLPLSESRRVHLHNKLYPIILG